MRACSNIVLKIRAGSSFIAPAVMAISHEALSRLQEETWTLTLSLGAGEDVTLTHGSKRAHRVLGIFQFSVHRTEGSCVPVGNCDFYWQVENLVNYQLDCFC